MNKKRSQGPYGMELTRISVFGCQTSLRGSMEHADEATEARFKLEWIDNERSAKYIKFTYLENQMMNLLSLAILAVLYLSKTYHTS